MRNIIFIIAVFSSTLLIGQCDSVYKNKEWSLTACIPATWYPKVETKKTITFFGDKIYHLKIDKEQRNSTYALQEMLVSKYPSKPNEILQKVDSSSQERFIVTYLTQDKTLEISYAIQAYENLTLYFTLVKKYETPKTHQLLLDFMEHLVIENRPGLADKKTQEFRVQFEDFVYNYHPTHEVLLNQEVWDELTALDSSQAAPFDFIAYLKESRKEYCDVIKELDSPKVTHYSLSPSDDEIEEGAPIMYSGELFISSKDKIIKSRFSAIEWKGKIYLMNIKAT